jgi:hypothetical protein
MLRVVSVGMFVGSWLIIYARGHGAGFLADMLFLPLQHGYANAGTDQTTIHFCLLSAYGFVLTSWLIRRIVLLELWLLCAAGLLSAAVVRVGRGSPETHGVTALTSLPMFAVIGMLVVVTFKYWLDRLGLWSSRLRGPFDLG